MLRKFNSNLSLILSEKPQKINICNKLPSYPDCVVKQIDSDVLAKETGMKNWTNAYVYTKETELQVIPEIEQAIPHYNDAAMTKLNQDIEMCNQKLCIGPMGLTGLGAFALETIEPGEPIGKYLGSIKSIPPEGHFATSKNEYGLNFDNLEGKTYGIVQARNYGNLTRFIQHAPRKTLPTGADQDAVCLDDYHFLTINKNEVATANIALRLIYYRGELVYYFVAVEKIIKGQMVVWDYNLQYWRTKETAPELFTKYGVVISRDFYKPRSLSIRVKFDNGDQPIDIVDKLPIGQYYDQNSLSSLIIQTPYGDMAFISKADISHKFKNAPLIFIWKESYKAWLAESNLSSQNLTPQFFKPKRASKKEVTEALKQLAKEFGIPKGAQYDLKSVKQGSVALITMNSDSHKTQLATLKSCLLEAGIKKVEAGFAIFADKTKKYCLYIYAPESTLFMELTNKLKGEKENQIQEKFISLNLGN